MPESIRAKIKRLKLQARLEPCGPVKLYVYLIHDGHGVYKIGRSENPKKRLSALQVGSSHKLTLIHQAEISNPVIERVLHRMFDEAREHGEWYRLTNDQIAFIKDL